MTEEILAIPDNDIVSMEHVARGVSGLRILFTNVFGVINPDGTWVLIDAGLPLSAGRIKSWAEEHFSGKPAALILTHGHFDHTGAAKTLAEDWDLPVYAHPLEMPFLTGLESYPPPDPHVGGGVMAILSPTYPKGPIDLGARVRAIDASGVIPHLEGWRVIHTPGHTVGHVSFFRESDRALLVGDAFCTVQAASLMKIAQMKPELHGPPAYYTPDWAAAKTSVLALAALRPMTLIPGHGQPISGADVPAKLEQLAARFDELAVPDNHKADVA